MYGQILQQNQ
jgi:hypothetical protein